MHRTQESQKLETPNPIRARADRVSYEKQIAEFWPTIMQAWGEHGDKLPVIECDVVLRKVAAMPAKEYIDGLTDRTRKVARRTYQQATAKGGIMVFIRDSKNRVLRSYVFTPGDTA